MTPFLPGTEAFDALVEYENAIADVLLETMLGGDRSLPSYAVSRLTVHKYFGRAASDIAPAAFLASAAQAQLLAQDLALPVPAEPLAYKSVLENYNSRTGLGLISDDICAMGPAQIQKKLSEQLLRASDKSLFETALTHAGRPAAVASMCFTKHALLPFRPPRATLDPEPLVTFELPEMAEFALRHVFSLPIVLHDYECPTCRRRADVYGDHIMACNALTTFRHNAVVRWLNGELRRIGCETSTEEALHWRPGDQRSLRRPGDIFVRRGAADVIADNTYIDVGIAAPETRTHGGSVTVDEPLAAAIAMVEAKKAKYAADFRGQQGATYMPFVIQSTGAAHKGAIDLLAKVARRIAGRSQLLPTAALRYLLTKVANVVWSAYAVRAQEAAAMQWSPKDAFDLAEFGAPVPKIL
jgi:hypothetical protein